MQALIDEVYGVWQFERPAGFIAKARSTPGHLIHFVASGRYRLTTDSRTYVLEAGDLVHYFESEDVLWHGCDVPVTFFSVGLGAPRLSPPDLGSRLLRGRHDLEETFALALALYDGPTTLFRRLKLLGAISDIVAEFYRSPSAAPEPEQSLWWQVENAVKRRRAFRADLSELCQLAGYSRATVIRACKGSTGATPMARLRELRIEEAKGLLLHSLSSVSDVAMQLGYGRVHEFSREFSKAVGMPPTVYRGKVLAEGLS